MPEEFKTSYNNEPNPNGEFTGNIYSDPETVYDPAVGKRVIKETKVDDSSSQEMKDKLVDQAKEHAHADNDALTTAVAEARKLLEGDTLDDDEKHDLNTLIKSATRHLKDLIENVDFYKARISNQDSIPPAPAEQKVVTSPKPETPPSAEQLVKSELEIAINKSLNEFFLKSEVKSDVARENSRFVVNAENGVLQICYYKIQRDEKNTIITENLSVGYPRSRVKFSEQSPVLQLFGSLDNLQNAFRPLLERKLAQVIQKSSLQLASEEFQSLVEVESVQIIGEILYALQDTHENTKVIAHHTYLGIKPDPRGEVLNVLLRRTGTSKMAEALKLKDSAYLDDRLKQLPPAEAQAVVDDVNLLIAQINANRPPESQLSPVGSLNELFAEIPSASVQVLEKMVDEDGKVKPVVDVEASVKSVRNPERFTSTVNKLRDLGELKKAILQDSDLIKKGLAELDEEESVFVSDQKNPEIRSIRDIVEIPDRFLRKGNADVMKLKQGFLERRAKLQQAQSALETKIKTLKDKLHIMRFSNEDILKEIGVETSKYKQYLKDEVQEFSKQSSKLIFSEQEERVPEGYEKGFRLDNELIMEANTDPTQLIEEGRLEAMTATMQANMKEIASKVQARASEAFKKLTSQEKDRVQGLMEALSKIKDIGTIDLDKMLIAYALGQDTKFGNPQDVGIGTDYAKDLAYKAFYFAGKLKVNPSHWVGGSDEFKNLVARISGLLNY